MNDLKISDSLYLQPCPGGEIGRRTVFRWQHPKGCAGSNPVPGTKALSDSWGLFHFGSVASHTRISGQSEKARAAVAAKAFG